MTAYGGWGRNGYSPQLGNDMTAPEKKPLRMIDWAAIRKAYEEGDEPVRIIAARHDISQGKINYRLAKEGWPRRRAARRPESSPQRGGVDWAEVRRDYEGVEYSVWEICVRHGFGKSRLYNRRNLENWEARSPGHPKAYGTGGTADATARLKALALGSVAALQARVDLGEKIDTDDALRGLHQLASAFQKIHAIEHREKLRDDGDRTGRLIINDATREALARRIESLAKAWARKGDSGRA